MIRLIPIPKQPDVELWGFTPKDDRVPIIWTEKEIAANNRVINKIIDDMKRNFLK